METKKKYLLVVQGEGRGHMTQALSMYDLLIERGNTICAVVIGSGGTREIPNFFFEKLNCPVYTMISPNFVSDKENKSINIFKTITYNLGKIGDFRRSMRVIDELIKEHEPDVIINFFDLLIGLYFRFYKPKTKMICIAHQYIYFHPDFEFPEGYLLDKAAIKLYTRLTSKGSTKNIALSFYKIHTRCDDVQIVPPLLRKEIFDLTPTNENYYLVYLVNNGYYAELIEWHRLNPTIELHCFTDKPELLMKQFDYRSELLHLHAINDKLFLEKMSHAKGLASSAGFESVCEAMYLDKPVLMVPIEGHFEQFCNSRDAYKAGAGVFDVKFNLNKLVNITKYTNENNKYFKSWVLQAKERIYNEIISI